MVVQHVHRVIPKYVLKFILVANSTNLFSWYGAHPFGVGSCKQVLVLQIEVVCSARIRNVVTLYQNKYRKSTCKVKPIK